MRSDREVLEALLRLIGTVRFRKSPDFRKRRGSGRRKRFFEVEQPLRGLTIGRWDSLRLPDTWRLYFRLEKRCHYRAWLDVLVFARPELFELKVEPNWITQVWECDPSVLQRIAEIENWLSHRNRNYRLNWLRDRSRHWYHGEPGRWRLLERLAERELRESMDGLSEVDPIVLSRALGSAFRALLFFMRYVCSLETEAHRTNHSPI